MRKRRLLKNRSHYHVIAKINRGEMILEENQIKSLFLEVVKNAKKKYKFKISNYCLMDNHVHILLKPLKKENLSKIMQWILSVFAIRYNKMFKLKGHVWYDRFKSKIIDKVNHFIDAFRYITNNPVKAELVSKPKRLSF